MSILTWPLRSKRNYLRATTIIWGTPMTIFFLALLGRKGELNVQLVIGVTAATYFGGLIFSYLTWEAWGKNNPLIKSDEK